MYCKCYLTVGYGYFLVRVVVCKTPGCFLQSLSAPGSLYCRSFKQNKDELTSNLYQLYNTSVFDSQVPYKNLLF